jgi:peptide/nickel transport system substrate-binding protein
VNEDSRGGLPAALQAALTRRDMLRRMGQSGAALSLLSGASLLAACGSSDSDDAARGASGGRIDTVKWSLESAPSTLDYSEDWNGDWQTVLWLLHETLVTYDESNAVVPALAERVTNPTDKQYAYTLREGVTFHDGTPLTVEDVLFSFEHAMRKDSQQTGYFGEIKSMEQTGDREITFTLKQVSAVFAYIPTLAPIIPKAFAEKVGKKLGKPGGVNWMGTGPYKLESFGGDSIVVVRNEDYWGTKPAAAKIAFSWITDLPAMRLAMESGQIDGTFRAEPTDRWKQIGSANLTVIPGMGTDYLGFNVTVEPWDDIHVRRAFAHALDRDGITRAAYGGSRTPATTMVPPVQWGAILSPEDAEELYATLPQYPYDIERAKEELAQSKVPDGFTTKLIVTGGQETVDAMVAFAGELKKIGITLDIENVPVQAWLEHVYGPRDKLSLTLNSLGPDYPDPGNYPSIVYPSSQAVEGGFNTASYKSKQMDELVARQNATLDPDERKEILTEILRISLEELPYLQLWNSDLALSLNKKYALDGFTPLAAPWTPWATKLKLA